MGYHDKGYCGGFTTWLAAEQKHISWKFFISSAYSCCFGRCFIWCHICNIYTSCFKVWYWHRELLSRSICGKMSLTCKVDAVNEWQCTYVLGLLDSSAGIWLTVMLHGHVTLPFHRPCQCATRHQPSGAADTLIPLQVFGSDSSVLGCEG